MAVLTLRTLTRAGDTTKNSPLTNLEVDQNFANLDADIDAITSALTQKANSLNPIFSGTVTIPLVSISGGNIDGTAIGSTSRSSGAFTTLTANGQSSLTANIPSTTTGTGTLVITGGLGVSGSVNASSFVGNFNGDGSSVTNLNASNFASGTLPVSRLTGTYSINISGNAATATSTSQLNGVAAVNYSRTDIDSFFNAGLGTNYNLLPSISISSKGTTVSGLELRAQGSGGTAGAPVITFTRPGIFSAYFGLDTDNRLKFGGWSGSLFNVTLERQSSISTNTLAVSWNRYIFTSSCILTLPASPLAGDKVYTNNRSGTTTCVVARNGNRIMGLLEDYELNTINATATFTYIDSTQGWVVSQ
jgi:hypothetical protein